MNHRSQNQDQDQNPGAKSGARHVESAGTVPNPLPAATGRVVASSTTQPPIQIAQKTSNPDPVLRWCLGIFIASTLALVAFAVYAVITGQVAIYLHAVGVIYLLLSAGFLGVVAVVFVQSHFVTSQEVEAPKLELFEMEKLQ